jgi:hypothetical protein
MLMMQSRLLIRVQTVPGITLLPVPHLALQMAVTTGHWTSVMHLIGPFRTMSLMIICENCSITDSIH